MTSRFPTPDTVLLTLTSDEQAILTRLRTDANGEADWTFAVSDVCAAFGRRFDTADILLVLQQKDPTLLASIRDAAATQADIPASPVNAIL